MATAALNGTEINYADTGGDGPVAVLSHGLLLDQSMFAPQVKALAPEFRVMTWDQRGHGWDQGGHGGTPARGSFSYGTRRETCWRCSTIVASSAPCSGECLRAGSSACAPRCSRLAGCEG
jgi:pimeloyl-ACP methyl ester carboxylesterase